MIHAREPLAEFWRVNETEVPKFLSNEATLSVVDQILQEEILNKHDSIFGGSVINAKANQIYVYTIDTNKANVIISNSKEIDPYRDLLIVLNVRNSFSLSKGNFDKIVTQARTKKYFLQGVTIYIDILRNNVVVYLGSTERKEYEKFVKAISKFNPIIEYPDRPPLYKKPRKINDNEPLNEEIIFHDRANHYSANFKARGASNDYLYPHDGKHNIQSRNLDIVFFNGDRIYNSRGGCTVGFRARNATVDYLVTAGHFIFLTGHLKSYYMNVIFDREVKQVHVGTAAQYKMNSEHGLIKIRHQEIKHSANIIHRESIDPNNPRSDKRVVKELFVAGHKDLRSYGVHICKAGYVTGTLCGEIIALNGIQIGVINGELQFSPNLYVAKSNIQDFNLPGDSGGPGFSYIRDLKWVSLNSITVARKPFMAALQPLGLILDDTALNIVKTGDNL
ncbi:13213_t:CDS:1 [Racocetra persica]|uniref:13213_t:CDS:1 n=1 Tax=Racocetra persica TaxID=160502 RepID=A0ACA9RJL0_9GLOM|nr:13213_t:CDS:1 [Racocetra persica]